MIAKSGAELGREMLDAVRGYVARSISPVMRAVQELERKFSALPTPIKGADGKDGIDGKDGRDGKDGLNGRDVDPAHIAALVSSEVARAVAAIPPAKDGLPGERGERGADGRDGKDGRDGIDGIDGKAGKDGNDGTSITVDDLRPMIEAEAASWRQDFERSAAETVKRFLDGIPKPVNGKDGKDAAQLDTFAVALDGRTLKLSLTAGDRVITKEVRLPIPFDKGVYRSGAAYEQGDVITYGGSQWIALKDTSEKPPSDSWRLQVRKGTDGKSS